MAADISVCGGDTDEVEAVAALAAITCVLEEEASLGATVPAPPGSGWHDAARLAVLGLPTARLPIAPRWDRVERLRRAGRGGSGVVGQ
ncbi:MAG: hypothetical protein OHK0015_22280 [Chloroflexi bacterium OHK40]